MTTPTFGRDRVQVQVTIKGDYAQSTRSNVKYSHKIRSVNGTLVRHWHSPYIEYNISTWCGGGDFKSRPDYDLLMRLRPTRQNIRSVTVEPVHAICPKCTKSEENDRIYREGNPYGPDDRRW